MDDKFNKFDLKPLERSNRGRKSKIPDGEFLKLIDKHYLFFLKAKMPPLNHEVITEFSQTLQITQKCAYLKVKNFKKHQQK